MTISNIIDPVRTEETETSREDFPNTPFIPYNQPESSPYELPIATIHVGPNKYGIPAGYLHQYPLIKKSCDLLDPLVIAEDIAHTLVHYLYTNTYETIDSPAEEGQSYVAQEYQRSLQVYHASTKYEIAGLQALAEEHMEYFGEKLTPDEQAEWTRNAFRAIPDDEIQFPKYVKNIIGRVFVPGAAEANLRSFAHINAGGRPDSFSTAVLWAAIESLLRRVHSFKIYARDQDSPGVKEDEETGDVPTGDAGNSDYVNLGGVSPFTEIQAGLNGSTVTLDGSAGNEPASFPVQAPLASEPEPEPESELEPKPERVPLNPLYEDWHTIGPRERKKRAKMLKREGLPIPGKDGFELPSDILPDPEPELQLEPEPEPAAEYEELPEPAPEPEPEPLRCGYCCRT